MKSNSHFWPAYVDMMTVLLLVYLLVTLIFQILLIIAQQNAGVKLRERNQVVTVHYKINENVDPNELRLAFDNNKNPNYLDSKNQEKLLEWFEIHKDEIEQKGAVVFSTTISSKDEQTGNDLKLQFERNMHLLGLIQDKVSLGKIKIENASVNKSDVAFVSIRILKAGELQEDQNSTKAKESESLPSNGGGSTTLPQPQFNSIEDQQPLLAD